MAIRMRRGPKDLFDPNKLLSGEIAVPLDTREIYTAFAPGDVQKMATHENVTELIIESTEEIIGEIVEGVEQATGDAQIAGTYALEQGDYAKEQGDYAKTQGDFAKEQGESAENSAESASNAVDNLEELEELVETQEGIRQDFYEQFKKWDDYSPDTLYKPGNKVLYSGSSYINNVESSGVLPTDSDYWQEIARKGRDGVGSGDMAKEVYDTQNKEQDIFSYTDAAIGDSSSYFEDLVTAVSDRVMDNLASINELELKKIDKANIVNNGITTEAGTVLDGRYGANLQNQVTTLTNNLVGEGWITATLLNGWTGTLQYRKNAMGQVIVKGSLNIGTLTKGTPIAALPVDYRPATFIPIIVYETYVGRAVLGMMVATNGNIGVYDPATTTLTTNAININTVFSI